MVRSFRVDYTKGISAVVEPRLLGDGYAVFMDNADLSAFAISSYRAPVYRMPVPDGTTCAFEYRGKWHFSSEKRHWAAEFIGKQERLYYTEAGRVAGAGKPPMKVIDGVEARLGTARPTAAPIVSTDIIASPAGFTVQIGTGTSSLPDGSATYRLGYRTVDGLLPPGEAITIAITKGQTPVLLWEANTLKDVTAVVIYGRASGKEQILDELTPDMVRFVDDGSMSPHGEYASNLDSSDVYFYFYTFLRKVNGHLDESGPSPISPRIDQGKVCKITRDPILEGTFDNAAAVTGAPAYATPTSHALVGSKYRAVGAKRIITTATNHGLVGGKEVGLIPTSASIDPNFSDRVYAASLFNADLQTPTISSFGPGSTTAPVWAPGTLLRARVSAFRGSGWDTLCAGSSGGVPAESLASAEVQWTTTAAKALLQWEFPSGDHDGFHVYINDLWVATIPADTLFYEFDTANGTLGRTPPASNTSSTRAFYIQEDPALVWDYGQSVVFGLWGLMATTIETKVGKVGHGLTVGALLSFSGYSELNGVRTVSRVGNADEFYVKVLTRADDTTSTTRAYKLANPAFQFVDQWALYVQRGATGGIALQQGVYPIGQTEVIDYKPVQGLTVTCDSSYVAPTPEGGVFVEFNPWPLGTKQLTLHHNILFGIVDNMVVWGPVNRPDAQPKAYRRAFPFQPVALASYAGALLVLLPNGVGRFDGTDPANLSFTMTAARDGCNAPNSLQHTAAGLVYLSPRGLMAFQAELNTSVPISDGKLEASIFTGPSSTAADKWPTWWIPTRSSAAWAKCTRGLPSADGAQGERQIDETLPLPSLIEDARSFYWRGRYYLYFTGDDFGRHGTIMVDTTRRNESGYPIFHLGLRPEHAHVTDRDQAFLLLKQQEGAKVLDLQACQLSKGNDTTNILNVGPAFSMQVWELSRDEGEFIPFAVRTGPMGKPDHGVLKRYEAVEINGEGKALVMAWVQGRLVASGVLYAQEGPRRPRRLNIPRGLGDGNDIDLFIAHQGRLTGHEVFYEVAERGDA